MLSFTEQNKGIMSSVLVLVCLFCLCFSSRVCEDNEEQRLQEAEKHLLKLMEALDERDKVINNKTSMDIHSRDRRATNEVVAFSATISGDITPLGNNEVIVYDGVKTNIGNAYDGLIGRFKTRIAGVYHFIATIMSYSTNYVEVEMVKDGIVLCRFRASNRYNAMGTCAANVYLTAGNDVWIRHYGTAGNYIRGNLYSSFAGHLIAAI